MPDANERPHYRYVGVGVEPANLSLASLLYSRNDVTNLFLDKKAAFGWHDGQQLPDTTLQVSMLKDLVTLADPANRFSFLLYLYTHGRIYHFINAKFDAVPRQEFRNYMDRASTQNKNVVFGEQVESVEFDGTFVVRTDQRVPSQPVHGVSTNARFHRTQGIFTSASTSITKPIRGSRLSLLHVCTRRPVHSRRRAAPAEVGLDGRATGRTVCETERE
jgi:hypothetical protein